MAESLLVKLWVTYTRWELGISTKMQTPHGQIRGEGCDVLPSVRRVWDNLVPPNFNSHFDVR